MATIELLSPDALRIIVAMAMGAICEDCETAYSCPHCTALAGWSELREDIPELDEIVHDADCPIVLARRLLAERGTPMNIYEMEADMRIGTSWREDWGYTLAISEEEAVRNWTQPTCRNIQATFVRPLPITEVK